MILVAGASGLVGSEVCRLLRGRDLPIRALVRRTTDPAKIQQLQSMGAELVAGDVRDRDSLGQACEGVKVVVSAVSSFQPQQPGDMQTVLQGRVYLLPPDFSVTESPQNRKLFLDAPKRARST